MQDDERDAVSWRDDDDDERRGGAVATGLGAWGMSLAIHGLGLALIALIVFTRLLPEQVPIRVEPLPLAVEQPEERKDRELIKREMTAPEVSENPDEPVVADLEVPVEEPMVETDEVSEAALAESNEASSVSEMGGMNAFMAIGGGSGAAGAYGRRSGAGRRHALRKGGGSPGSEGAVDRALRWFVRHQSPDGRWDVDGYGKNCALPGPKCEPGTARTGKDGDVACTAYAVLCFLGAGHDHLRGTYAQVVRDGLDFLVAQQGDDGSWGRNYENGVATMALCEAYGMSEDRKLRASAQRGVDYLLRMQAEDGDGYKLAWNYTSPRPERNDASVSGWCLMALKSARLGGLAVGEGLAGGKEWFERAWQAANPDHATIDQYGVSVFPYAYDGIADANMYGKDGVAKPAAAIDEQEAKADKRHLACVGALCAVFLGYDDDDPRFASMINWIARHQTPQAWPTDTYYLYYNTMAMFMAGGEQWRDWNAQTRDLLVDSQRRGEGCFDGSWNPQGAGGHHVAEVGRVLVTAYACLSLEVYYRSISREAWNTAGLARPLPRWTM
ncbi:MAG: prenyltransferase/squalene oxidase repeat-containing protein [Planctomycetota bacterium]|jgi:hypothetical protein